MIGSNSRGRAKLIKETGSWVEADDHQVGRIASREGLRLAERTLTKDGGEKEADIRHMSVRMGKVEQRSIRGGRNKGREEP